MTADKASGPADGLVERLKGRRAFGRFPGDTRWFELDQADEDCSEAAATITRLSADLEEARGLLEPTVSIESVAKIIRRAMQNRSIPAKRRSEVAAVQIASVFRCHLSRAAATDPMEQMTGEALAAAGVEFITDHEPDSPANLDFYLPAHDIHIEVKRFHSDRIGEQLKRAENVILAQGQGAVAFLANLLTRTEPRHDVD